MRGVLCFVVVIVVLGAQVAEARARMGALGPRRARRSASLKKQHGLLNHVVDELGRGKRAHKAQADNVDKCPGTLNCDKLQKLKAVRQLIRCCSGGGVAIPLALTPHYNRALLSVC